MAKSLRFLSKPYIIIEYVRKCDIYIKCTVKNGNLDTFGHIYKVVSPAVVPVAPPAVLLVVSP
jgi:hypothetical protein